MTWTTTGSWLFAGSANLTVSNQAVGNLLLVGVTNDTNNTVWCTGLSGGGATWTLLGTKFASATAFANYFTLFAGFVTATGAGTVTPSWSGAAPANFELNGREFHSSSGSWVLDVQGNLDSAGTANWASLTPAISGELYFGFEGNAVAASAGTTSGYVYTVDTNNNGVAYNLSCAFGVATFPVWADSDARAGIMVLVKEVQATLPLKESPAPEPQQPPGWFPGADRVATRPYGIPFYAQPVPVTEPGAVIIPPTPEAAGFTAPLIPPGWFPGADRVTAGPGEIPFAQVPAPADPSQAILPPPAPDNNGEVQWLPWPPNYFPGSQAVAVDPGGIPFYAQPQPLLPPPPPPPMPVLCQLAGTPGPGWFTDQFGSPRLWVATETWCLPVRAGEWNGGNWRLDYDTFFTDRAAQGVTVTITDPFQSGADPVTNAPFLNGSTWDGINPFTSPGVLNGTFWTRIDYMIDAANRQGITIAFTFNTGYDFVAGGPYDTWTNATFLAFGQALGTRYGSKQNIVWMFGNDVFPGSYDANWDNVITGLRGNGANQLIGAWWHSEYTSRYETDNNTAATWGAANSQFNFTYTYNAGYWVIEYAYNETAAPDSQAHLLPVVEGDGYWFAGNATYSSTQDRAWRQEKWWALSSGSRGILTESENVWQWASAAALAAVTTDWSFVNTLPAITSYFQGLPGWYKLLPDLSSAFVTAGRGTRISGFSSGGTPYEPAFTNSYVTASKTPDGTLAILYLPASTTVTVNTALLAPGWTATWVDPVNTATSSAGSGPAFNSTAKGVNSQGDPDWVLVLQAPITAPVPTAPQVNPLPPGWFPGADRVTALPGGIPFYVIPQPADQVAAAPAATANINAGIPAATGAAPGPVPSIAAVPLASEATGAAPQATANVSVLAGIPAATGTAPAPVTAPSAVAGIPAATGQDSAVANVQVLAGIPAATGAAPAPSIQTGLVVNAGIPTATGAAPQPVIAEAVQPGIPAATGTAPATTASISLAAGIPSATGTASQPVPAITALAGIPAATGTSPAPGIVTGLVVNAPAVTATGTAPQPVPQISTAAQVASSTGTAPQPAAAHAALAGVPSATGGAAAVASIIAVAGIPSATVTPVQPVVSVSVLPGFPVATGASPAPGIVTGLVVNAPAASASGAASQPVAAESVLASVAMATGTAPSTSKGVFAGIPVASATAPAALTTAAVHAPVASVSATAADAQAVSVLPHVTARATSGVSDPRDGSASVTEKSGSTGSVS